MGMTATERLRALLDERGVEWWQSVNMLGCVFTRWYSPLFSDEVVAMENGDGELELFSHLMTPEQAIAATLSKEPDDAAMLKLHDRMNAALLEYERALGSEKADGAITVPFVAEMHHLLEEAATLGSCNCSNSERTGTCRLENFADVPFSVDYEIEGYDMGSSRDYATLAECSSCGAYVIVPPSYHHVLTCDGDEVYQPYRFCPNCGRRIEVDDG